MLDLMLTIGFYILLMIFVTPIILFVGMMLLFSLVGFMDKHSKRESRTDNFDIF